MGGGIAPSPDSELGNAIDRSYGSFDEFIEQFYAAYIRVY